MPLTAAQICSIAANRAKVPGFTADQSACLNLALQWFAQRYDFEVLKAPFNFNFTGATAPIGNLQATLASGPFTLPADYLRAKRGDIQFYPVAGYPFQLTPIDLNEFDHQWQQAGFQNYPIFWATDTSLRRDLHTTTASLTRGSGVMTNVVGNSFFVGCGIYSDFIKQGTVAQVTSFTATSTGYTVNISHGEDVLTTGDNLGITFATNPVAYVWPPAGGAYPCFVRYYRKPSDYLNPTTSEAVPWFEWQDTLVDAVTGRLMHESDDSRALQFLGEGQPNSVPTQMRSLLQMKDDMANRARRVSLDRRRFGAGWSNLPKSKATFGF